MVKKCLLAGCLAAGGILLAADTTGTVSAAKGLRLNGQEVPVAGTRNWPVASGDVVRSESAPVTLQLKDGSRVVLGQRSEARLDGNTIRLTAGSMRYERAAQATTQFAVNQEVLTPAIGQVAVSGGKTSAVLGAAKAVTEEPLPPVSRRRP